MAQAPPKIAFANWREVTPDFGRESPEFREFTFSFPSPIITKYPVNDVVPVTAILPPTRDSGLPVVIALHYWGATDQRTERGFARELARRGIATVMVALPFHLQRTPPGTRSGELAIVPRVPELIQTMTQAALDVRRTVDWITSNPVFDPNRIGIAGTSLGGVVESLVVGLEPRIRFSAFMLGGANLAHLIWNSSRVVEQRDHMRSQGFTESRLKEALAAVEPTTYLKPDPNRRAFVVAARHDTVIPGASTEALIEALGKPGVLWLDTGHYGGVLVQRQVLRSVATFFEACFSERDFVPPTKLDAPTIRLGVLWDSTGIQVGAGLGLFKVHASPNPIASFLITPKGPGFFAGYELDRGISVGLNIRAGKTTVGLLWSRVL